VQINEKYEAVIGLEVHAQLNTASKLFCADSTLFGSEPNTQVSPISLAHPGTLPRLNRAAVEHAIRLGLALQCEIAQHNYFARKHYFYPDLPKAYQISQHTTPICSGGRVPIQVGDGKRSIQLNRIHIEEDAGKSIHDANDAFTRIDLNRAGTPLLEIVSEPDLHTPEEAYAYLSELRRLVQWLGICDGNMEEGSMRCDANVSIRLRGETKLGTRVEVKNLNSVRNLKKAVEIEIGRLIELSETGQPIRQETRSFDADQQRTFTLRSKEDAEDYRYFPDPDLAPITITEAELQAARDAMPELPWELENRLQQTYQLSAYDANQLASDRHTADFVQQLIQAGATPKAATN
jgi:aspartyl-tRNA(Asn)/glutamyl-tRNA(Gln) amidotransferase subunit B